MSICKKDKILYYLAQLTVLASFLIVVHMATLLLMPQNILKQDPIRMESNTVKRGENIVLLFDFCKYKEYPSTVSFFLVDNTPFALRTIEGNLPLGCRTGMKYAVLIPETAEPGVYKIRQVITYHVNGIRNVSYFFETPEFTVTK